MKLPSISLSQDMLSRFENAIQKEWIITNGLGGYASSTVLSINTRKYHGLLVAAFHPPGDRRVSLAKLDEEISIGNNTYPLGANEFQNGVFPKGHMFLKEFSVSPFPRYSYAVDKVKVEKTILMPHEKNAVIALYNVSNKSSFSIKTRVFPLINGRHFHSVTNRWKIPWEFAQKQDNKEAQMQFGLPKSVLVMRATNGRYHAIGEWIEKIYYREEAARGESSLDDCYRPGYFETSLNANEAEKFAFIMVADENEDVARKILAELPFTIYDIEDLQEREIKYREDLLTRFYEEHKGTPTNDWLNWAILAADMFMVNGVNDEQRSIIAGYHWFEAWGRDTFISLPGLMLLTGRFEDARKVFLFFRKRCKDGLIPNFIPDQAQHLAYNAVDATLWYVNASLQYLKYTSDFRFV
ncbi:MAG: amylo-alpha-1,6-glucosidase, partial [Candidatus Bathyarchaeota archaeon]|nr:amylo-alpha-1,6-glucosidase [Candidatus Bathyarchaeota archaeon]